MSEIRSNDRPWKYHLVEEFRCHSCHRKLVAIQNQAFYNVQCPRCLAKHVCSATPHGVFMDSLLLKPGLEHLVEKPYQSRFELEG